MPYIRHIPLLLTLIALLFGCDKGETSSTAEKQPVGAPSTLVWPLSSAVTSLDPTKMTGFADAIVARQNYDTLVRLDHTLSLTQGIARKWQVDATGREYLFQLRPGGTFHDGTALTASDVKSSLERLARTGKKTYLYKHLKFIVGYDSFISDHARELKGVEVVDPLTVRIKLERPHAPLLPALSNYQASIVRALGIDDQGNQRLVGSGPFIVHASDEQRLEMRPFESFVDGRPRVDKLIFKIYSGYNIQKAAEDFLSGELSAVPFLGAVAEMLKDRSGFSIVHRNMLSLFYYGFNVRKNNLSAPVIRKHIASALDKRRLFSLVYDNKYFPAESIIPLGLAGHRPNQRISLPDLEASASLAFPTTIKMLSMSKSREAEAEMDYLAERLGLLGISLEVEYIPQWNDFVRRLAEGDHDMFRIAWYPDIPDLDEVFYPLFHSHGEFNYSGYSNLVVDELIEQARATHRTEDRIRLYQQAEDILLSDLPIIPLWNGSLDRAVKRNVHGLDWSPLGELSTSFASVWIE